MPEAAKIVNDGDIIATSGFALTRAPMAFARELVRQKKKNLTVVGTTVTLDADMLVGAGAVKALEIATGGVYIKERWLYNIWSKVESGKLKLDDWSNLSMAIRFFAGALNIPYIPTKILLGSDILKYLPPDKIKESTCPFTGEKVTLIRAVKPDVAIIHAQCADSEGNTIVYGSKLCDFECAMAARKTIVTVEEILPRSMIIRQPELTTIPAFKVDAVVLAPYGAHPLSCYKYYDYDDDHIFLYKSYAKKGEEAFKEYLDKYVYGIEDHWEYLKMVGIKKLYDLKADPELGY
jgi:acyl CoA:acetate/3-ketoacid CoA transferase alpha subunit